VKKIFQRNLQEVGARRKRGPEIRKDTADIELGCPHREDSRRKRGLEVLLFKRKKRGPDSIKRMRALTTGEGSQEAETESATRSRISTQSGERRAGEISTFRRDKKEGRSI